MKLDPEVEVVLEFARTAHEPSSAVRLQNLEAVRSRLGVPPSSPRADKLAGRRWPANRPAKLSASLRQLVATGVVTGTVGVLVGFGLGRRASDAAPERPRAVAAVVQAAAAARAETPNMASELGSTPAAPEQQAADRAERARAELARQTPPRRARGGHSSAKPGDARPTNANDRSFFVALRLIERARRALDAGEPMLAQSLLDELDERFPPDLLAEERLAARALGWCALGERGRAESAARKLLADSPRSIYAERLEQSCVGARAMGSK